MNPSPGPRPIAGTFSTPNSQPRPALAVPQPLQRAVALWSQANLAGRASSELERALDLVCKHPDAYSSGYSMASNTRRRLTAELASRTEKRLNQLNTTRKPQPLT